MKRALIILLALSACSRGAVVVDRPTVVKVPVTQPCLSGARPVAVDSLKTTHPDWYDLTVKQKAELAAAQALRIKSYAQDLEAVTGACK